MSTDPLSTPLLLAEAKPIDPLCNNRDRKKRETDRDYGRSRTAPRLFLLSVSLQTSVPLPSREQNAERNRWRPLQTS